MLSIRVFTMCKVCCNLQAKQKRMLIMSSMLNEAYNQVIAVCTAFHRLPQAATANIDDAEVLRSIAVINTAVADCGRLRLTVQNQQIGSCPAPRQGN